MADGWILMHNHDNVGRSVVVRIFQVTLMDTTLTVPSLQRLHVWFRERRSRRAHLRIHLLLDWISCGRLISCRASFDVGATRTATSMSANQPSRMPNAAGQYYWVGNLAPPRYGSFLSWITGWSFLKALSGFETSRLNVQNRLATVPSLASGYRECCLSCQRSSARPGQS